VKSSEPREPVERSNWVLDDDASVNDVAGTVVVVVRAEVSSRSGTSVMQVSNVFCQTRLEIDTHLGGHILVRRPGLEPGTC
jgi:hypothetical protein